MLQRYKPQYRLELQFEPQLQFALHRRLGLGKEHILAFSGTGSKSGDERRICEAAYGRRISFDTARTFFKWRF